MAEVLVTLKVMPADAGLNTDELIEKIKGLDVGKLHGVEKEPIAFGLVALKPTFVTEDAEGVMDKIEDAIRELEGVGEVEVLMVNRLLG